MGAPQGGSFSSLASQFLSRLLSTLSTLYVSRLSLYFSFFLRFSFRFWTARFTFFFYIFFFFFFRFTWAPTSWAGRLGWFMIFGRGHELQSKGGPSFFYFFLKIYLLKIFFFGVGGPKEATPRLLRPPPESILDLM